MAHLWQFQTGNWHPAPLAGSALGLSVEGELHPVRPADNFPIRLCGVDRDWVLLAVPAARVRVNGELLGLGCRVLRDRDEIVFGGLRTYFSTERLARIEQFPGAVDKVFCVRCKQQIEPGTPAVQCPACNRWYHESGELHCWTYGEACGLCPHPTGLEEGYQWEPQP